MSKIIPIIKVSVTEEYVEYDEIWSDCFGPIVSIPLPDGRAKFFIGSEKLPPIVGPSLTCQTTADHLQLLLFTRRKFSHWSDFSTDFPPDPPILQSVRQWDAGLIRWISSKM